METKPDQNQEPEASNSGEETRDAAEETSFADLFEAQSRRPKDRGLQPGDPVRGRVVLISREAVFIDYGAKAEGWAALEEFLDADGQPTVSPGDEVSLKFIEYTPSGVHLGTSFGKSRGSSAAAQEMLRRAYEAQIPVEGTVLKTNKGGLEVNVSGAVGFCPLSQIDLYYCQNPEAYIGTSQKFLVTEFEEEGRRIILSRKAVLQEEKEVRAAKIRETLAEGQVYEGTVTRLMPFGAFVDLGGIEGLLHISEISREQVAEPGDRLKVGQVVPVQVIRLDRGEKGEERISLSMKALEPDPWQTGLPFAEGDTIEGLVRNLTTYGAFVEVAPGVEGLVHISEISHRRITHPQQVLTPGQKLMVKVLGIDREKHRVALSAREVADLLEEGTTAEAPVSTRPAETEPAAAAAVATLAEGEAPAAKPPQYKPPKVGLITRGVVSGVKPYGLFLDLPELGSRTRGLLHQSEFQSASGSSSLKGLKEGETLEVQIIRIDDQGKISLSQKSIREQQEASDLKNYLGQAGGSGKLGTMADLFKNSK
ncbi:MAG: S1 RNA-binding domain-containing protein [Deltaproteobacteria bacterium]|nr:S1 RNA-binding domain-containing protein [Deltaproteobacteria bacterium]